MIRETKESDFHGNKNVRFSWEGLVKLRDSFFFVDNAKAVDYIFGLLIDVSH